MPKEGTDVEGSTAPVQGHAAGKGRAWTWTETFSFSHTTLYPQFGGRTAPSTAQIFDIIEVFQFETRLKKIDYIKPLDCKQDSIYPEVICPVVWRKAFFCIFLEREVKKK